MAGGPVGFAALAPAQPLAGDPAQPGAEAAAVPASRAFEVKRYDFVVQFCWQPKTRLERREAAAKRLAAEAEAAAAKEAAAAEASGMGEPAQ